MCFLRTVEGYKMADQKCEEDIREMIVAAVKPTTRKPNKWILKTKLNSVA
jgi:hypothetical protein